MAGTLFVGTSGWSYKHWRQVFYPQGLTPARHLSFYAQQFDSVEVNYSFYRLPPREVFARWRSETPSGFVFAVKASRYLTHRKKLNEPAEPLKRLIECASGLDEKLGPLLFQFPAQWAMNLPRLADFLQYLPEGHRYAFEFRHPDWLCDEVFAALEKRGCALCIPDHPDLPREVRLTANFSYLRFHSGGHGANYEPAELDSWAKRLRSFLEGGADVYAYFNNDVSGFAVSNALALRSLLAESARTRSANR